MNALAPKSQFVIELEQDVLGAILVGGDIRRINFLEDSHFVEPIHGAIYRVIKTAMERYNSTTMPIVARLIPDDLAMLFKVKLDTTASAYLARLAANTLTTDSGLENGARKVVEQWARMCIAHEASLIQAAAQDPASDPSELVSKAGVSFDDIMASIRRGPKRKTRTILAGAASNAIAAAREAQQRGSGLTGITWGLTDVNRLTGGMQRRDLTLIAARPSMGKTTVALSTAISAARSGAGVGFVSLEMDADKLGSRALTDLAFDWGVKVAYSDLIRGDIQEREIEAIESATRDLERLPLWIEDQSGLTMLDIRAKVEGLMTEMSKSGHDLDVLFVDHLGLIRPSSRYQGNRTNEVAEITAGMKQIAREFGISVVLLSQLNRALEQRGDKRPQLSDLRDSGAIEQDADTIIFLYREAYYLQRERGSNFDAEADRIERLADCQNKLEFIVAKQRNGQIATVDLFADMACAAIRNGVRR